MDKYKAKAGAGAIMDVNTGEVVALASLPDFDPNDPPDMRKPENLAKINRINVGTYEMGSTFKALTISMALDSGKYNRARGSTRATACVRGASPSTISTPPTAC